MNDLVIVGDALLDRDLDGHVERLCPDAPVPVVDDPVATTRAGGAGLAATVAAADGRGVTLVTALGDDAAATELRGLLEVAGVHVVAVPLRGRTPEKIRVRADGRSLLRMDHGGKRAAVGSIPDRVRRVVENAPAVLVSDYGRGLTDEATIRTALTHAARSRPLVWDPHPRGADPVPGARLVTPNRSEAERFAPTIDGDDLHAVTARARLLRRRWTAGGVSVTLGATGALLLAADGTPLMVPATAVPGAVDSCGAGDRYASQAAASLADGALLSDAVIDAVAAASAFVAAGGAAGLLGPRGADAKSPRPPGRDAEFARLRGGDASTNGRRSPDDVLADWRQRGGTVVATGGCFDLLHAGHVQMLSAARGLGDCLIVCLNSDASVRRLKGPGRPIVPAADRAAVLLGLGCVDAVAVFDEDTPEAILDTLRPDVWAKGADYAVTDLPEAALMESWGGQAVVLPYLAGRSTTTLIQEALRHD